MLALAKHVERSGQFIQIGANDGLHRFQCLSVGTTGTASRQYRHGFREQPSKASKFSRQGGVIFGMHEADRDGPHAGLPRRAHNFLRGKRRSQVDHPPAMR